MVETAILLHQHHDVLDVLDGAGFDGGGNGEGFAYAQRQRCECGGSGTGVGGHA